MYHHESSVLANMHRSFSGLQFSRPDSLILIELKHAYYYLVIFTTMVDKDNFIEVHKSKYRRLAWHFNDKSIIRIDILTIFFKDRGVLGELDTLALITTDSWFQGRIPDLI